MSFIDRKDAGTQLATLLKRFAGRSDVIILGLARGGVPVAYEVSKILSLPLDALTVRKLGVPSHEELAFGAIASGDTIVLNDDIVSSCHIDEQTKQRVIQEQQRLLATREARYRGNRAYPTLSDKTVIIIDDGIATGATMRVAIKAVQQKNPKAIVVATPVAPPDTLASLLSLADDCVCVLQPPQLMSIGQWYDRFSQTSDEEVLACLEN